MAADDIQEGGDHYKVMGAYQPWAVIEKWLTPEQFRGYLLGSAVAYLGRVNSQAKDRSGLIDIRKARHYLDKLIEVEEAKIPTLTEVAKNG